MEPVRHPGARLHASSTGTKKREDIPSRSDCIAIAQPADANLARPGLSDVVKSSQLTGYCISNSHQAPLPTNDASRTSRSWTQRLGTSV
jgi:hypothetical protein